MQCPILVAALLEKVLLFESGSDVVSGEKIKQNASGGQLT